MTHAFSRVRSALILTVFAGAMMLLSAMPAQAAVEFESAYSATNVNEGATGLGIAAPAGIVAGDVLIAGISYGRAVGSTITPPAGWVLIETIRHHVSGDELGLRTYYKVALEADETPQTYIWTSAPAQRMAGGIMRYSGVDTTNPVMAVAMGSQNSGSPIGAPPVSTYGSNVRVINVFAASTGTTLDTHSVDSTERFDVRNGHTDGPSVAAADFVQATAGTTGAKSVTTTPTAGARVAQTLALFPTGTAPFTTAPRSATFAEQIASTGDIAWTVADEDVLENSDDVWATTASMTASGQTTNYLRAGDFGFTIPNNAVITGIQVKVERSKAGNSAGVSDEHVYLVKNDGGDATIQTDENKASSSLWPTQYSDAYASYGGARDLWSNTWTPADINHENFGVVISAARVSGNATDARVDHVQIAVSYTLASSSSSHNQHHPATASILQPNGGETLEPGQNTMIIWSTGGSGIAASRLSLSADGGATYPLLITNDGGFGAFSWTVPDINTTQARVRVEALDSNGEVVATSVSMNNFTIAGAGNIEEAVEEEAGEEGSDEYHPPTIQDEAVSINHDKSLTPDMAPENPLCTPGGLVKLADDGDPNTQHDTTVYYCGNDGKRYVFPNAQTFHTWFADFSSVVIIDADTLAQIPLGGNVTYKPGSRMLKMTSDPKVYAVDHGGVLRWVTTEEVAINLYGPNWATMVDDLSEANFSDYTIGEPIH